MTICERLFETIDKKALKTADLARVLNIKQSVISNWRKRNTNPPIEYALVICDFLGITIEELITGNPGPELTIEEQKLVNAYREADPKMQAATRKLLDLPEPEPERSSCSRTG